MTYGIELVAKKKIKPLVTLTNMLGFGGPLKSLFIYFNNADEKYITKCIPHGVSTLEKIKTDLNNYRKSHNVRLWGIFGIDNDQMLKIQMHRMNYFIASLLNSKIEYSDIRDIKDAIAYCKEIRQFYIELIDVFEPVANILKTEVDEMKEYILTQKRKEYLEIVEDFKPRKLLINKNIKVNVKLNSKLLRNYKMFNKFVSRLDKTLETLYKIQSNPKHNVKEVKVVDVKSNYKRPVYIQVVGGVAEVGFNPTNANVAIVDIDNGEQPFNSIQVIKDGKTTVVYDDETSPPTNIITIDMDKGDIPIHVLITVRGGVAYETYVDECVELHIIDSDNQQE